MLSTKDLGRLEDAFRTLDLTKGLTLDEDEFGYVALSLNLPYTDFNGVPEIDTFYFNEEETESYQAFADALLDRAEEYDPIESLFQIISIRKHYQGEERAKYCLRFDLKTVDIIDSYLFELAKIAQKMADRYEENPA